MIRSSSSDVRLARSARTSSPCSGRLAAVRSFTSGINQDRAKANSATGTAVRKTTWIDWAYAPVNQVCTAAGHPAAPWFDAAERGRRARPDRRWRGSRSRDGAVICELKTVPKIATPTELPIDRKNVAPLVAVPRSR